MMQRLCLTALLMIPAAPVLAGGSAWDDIRDALYGRQALLHGDAVIAIDAPYRTPDDARADLGARVTAPEGTTLSEVTLVLDDNPMPVSAVFRFDQPVPMFDFDVTMRVNGPTPMHVVARTSDGRLFATETFVKTTGQGACAAPPGTDPALALETLGDMRIAMDGQGATLADDLLLAAAGADLPAAPLNRIAVDIDHPSHSGMQMDQVSLLYTPMRFVETVKIELDGAAYVEMTGSISLSEDPRIGISVPATAQGVEVTMIDTDGTVSHAMRDLSGY
jgi:sulfur-oxidizing protein SoxY